jgi:hypothetical protein
VPTSLCLSLGLLLLVVINPGEAMTHKTMRETTPHTETLSANHIAYLTPGCKKTGRRMKKHVGMCARDSMQLNINGQLALLLDEKPWVVSDLADMRRRELQTTVAGDNLLLYTPATTVIDGPLLVQNISIDGYFRIGNITLGPESDVSALQGPQGEQGEAGPQGLPG